MALNLRPVLSNKVYGSDGADLYRRKNEETPAAKRAPVWTSSVRISVWTPSVWSHVWTPCRAMCELRPCGAVCEPHPCGAVCEPRPCGAMCEPGAVQCVIPRGLVRGLCPCGARCEPYSRIHRHGSRRRIAFMGVKTQYPRHFVFESPANLIDLWSHSASTRAAADISRATLLLFHEILAVLPDYRRTDTWPRD